VPSFEAAIDWALLQNTSVFVIGGRTIYQQALVHPRLRYGYITMISDAYYNPKINLRYPLTESNGLFGSSKIPQCDVFFPHELLIDVPNNRDISFGCLRVLNKYLTYDFTNIDEVRYLNLLKRLLDAKVRTNRTGVDTLSIFHETLSFDLSSARGAILPLLTTKRVHLSAIFYELMWFLRGDTTTEFLKQHNVTIWDGNTTREFLNHRGLETYTPGELGPGYGFQWRHAGADFTPQRERRYVTQRRCAGDQNITETNEEINGMGIDQLSNVIEEIKTQPDSRRLVVSAWNVGQLDQMALVPCHYAFQFYVDNNQLNCLVNMRSADVFLGVPFNIASYALLVHFVSHLTNLKPGKLVISMCDCHLYTNHVDAAKKQLQRVPRRFPTITLSPRVLACTNVDEVSQLELSDILVKNYKPYEGIKAKMAV
jgi:thymidylate synthase